MKKLDLKGFKSGRLTGIKPIGKDKNNSVLWECLCDCGNTAILRAALLKNGHTKSCGCLQRERASKACTTHGMRFSPEWRTWRHIKDRCYNPNTERYPHYGGRGIKVCDRWLNSFENFYADMGKKPEGYSIERINIDGDYSPENCKWIALRDQANNKKNNKFVTFKGKTQTVAQWAEELGFNKQTLYSRLNGYGWSVEKSLTTPI